MKPIVLVSMIVLGLTVACACALSYYHLGLIPYGFHVDEMSGSIDTGCLSTEGVDAHNAAYPMFSNVGYGTPKPPTFLYPALLWSKFFGYSAPSLRALSVTVHLLGVMGLFLLARSFFGGRCALMTTTVAMLSPWTFGLSRVGFESLFASTFLIWGLYLFFKPPAPFKTVFTALLFSAAMYSYPPFRLEIPLMIFTLYIYSHSKNLWDKHSWTVFFLILAVSLAPLLQKTLSGEVQQRFNSISIFHDHGSIMGTAAIFIHNYFLHFTPDFLFLRGDPSYVHSTRHFGILSWLDMAALSAAIFWLFKRNQAENPWALHKTFVLFLFFNILIGVLPAALTNSELPNSLRITAAWPFMCLFSGFWLWQACEKFEALWIGACLLAVLFAVSFFHVYFKVFPQEGKGMFSYWSLDQAKALKTDEDWVKFVVLYRHQDYNARYYLMQYRGLTCSQSQKTWEQLKDYARARGID